MVYDTTISALRLATSLHSEDTVFGKGQFVRSQTGRHLRIDIMNDISAQASYESWAALVISPAQSVFSNLLLHGLHRLAPEISVRTVLAIGASEVREKFAGGELRAIARRVLKACMGR